jgi:hypothetical protein
MSLKNSSDTIGNRTRVLPTCSTVPQPTGSVRHYIPYFLCNVNVHYHVPQPVKSTPRFSSVVLEATFLVLSHLLLGHQRRFACWFIHTKASLVYSYAVPIFVVAPQTKRLGTPGAPETLMLVSGCRTLVVTCYSAMRCSSECDLLDRATRNNTTTRLE